MFNLRWLFLFLFISGICFHAFSQQASEKPRLDSNNQIKINLGNLLSDGEGVETNSDFKTQVIDKTENLLEFTNNWKIKSGDDTLWKEPGYDDSTWEEYSDTTSSTPNKSYSTIVWYRMHFDIDSSLLNRPLALILHLYGSAAEIYLNGKLLKNMALLLPI